MLTVIISLVLPLIKVSYFTIETNQNFYLLLSQLNQNQLQNSTNDLTIYQVFYAIIGVVSIALLIRLILGITRIQSIKNQFPNETIEGIKFYQTNLNNAPFSYFRNLFWKQSIQLDSPVGQQILKHEMVHIQQKHSWDKLLMQTVKSVFWFNPVFYFINNEINLIHEYLADNKAVKKSDTRAFAQMLLESHFSGSVIPVTSPFLSSNLKKRLKMLTKNQTKYSYARKLFALPILFFMVFAYMVNAKNKEITETNKAIEIAVNELKNDTIKPQTSELEDLSTDHQRQTRVYSDALQEDHLKMSAISKKMADKGKELSALKKAKKDESPEYKALETEMETLASQMENIVNSDNYKKNMKGLEENAEALAKIYESPEWQKKYQDIEKRSKEIEAKFKSAEFKNKIANAEKLAKETERKVNSPEFKKRIADAEKLAFETEKKINSAEFKKRIADSEKSAKAFEMKFNSPEFQKFLEQAQKIAKDAGEKFGKIYTDEEFKKMIEDQYGKNAFSDGTVAHGFDASKFPEFKDLPKFEYNFNDTFTTTEVTKLSSKELKKLDKKRKEIEKKRKELQEEQRKLQLKQQELNKEMRQNSPWVISVNATKTPLSQKTSALYGVSTFHSNEPKTEIFLDGKKISPEEMKELSASNISRIDIDNFNKQKTVKIVTK
ncbi:M56 family metallopeptidase [Epilithonimonas xixisoli]|uniref:M56 family metallopeptidase n=1 Tax=Epilithonimonas xixisoli TaxID=1476462 RepID=UPI001416F631|nr:M56 family metallopeptidase [Epilithonimonas xixisoli]